jgi:M6 family metalloprotease-like protein
MKNKNLLLILPLVLLGCFSKTNTSLVSSSSSVIQPSSPSSSSINEDISNPDYITYKQIRPTLMPSTGTITPVIFFVDFDDYKATNEEYIRTVTAFNGPSEETVWTSVKDFYDLSSYGLLDLVFEVPSEFHTMRHESSYYDANAGQNILEELIQDFGSEYFADEKYDSDSDGIIDGVIIIYTHPSARSSSWWGSASIWLEYEVGNVTITNFFSASIDYNDAKTRFCEDYTIIAVSNYEVCTEDTTRIGADAATYIHEIGHLMGLPDYYDNVGYDGYTGGLGGIDIMDLTYGDNNAWSKIMLGWITPPRITSGTINLDMYGLIDAQQAVVIGSTKEYLDDNDYYVIAFYQISKINKFTYYMEVDFEPTVYYTKPGLIIYHVNLGESPEHISNNNSNTEHKLISLVEADNDDSIDKRISSCPTGYLACDNDIFTATGTYQLSLDLSYGYNGKVDFILDIRHIYEDHADFSITLVS